MKKIGAVFLLIEIAVLLFVVINTAAVPDRPNMDAIYLNTEPAFILQDKDSAQTEETLSAPDSLAKLQSIVAALLKNFTQNGQSTATEHQAENNARGQNKLSYSICPYAKNCRSLAA